MNLLARNIPQVSNIKRNTYIDYYLSYGVSQCFYMTKAYFYGILLAV